MMQEESRMDLNYRYIGQCIEWNYESLGFQITNYLGRCMQ
jgi:hypothetical protein